MNTTTMALTELAEKGANIDLLRQRVPIMASSSSTRACSGRAFIKARRSRS